MLKHLWKCDMKELLFFQLMKKREKKKRYKKKIIKNKWTNLSIIMVEEQNMSKEIFE